MAVSLPLYHAPMPDLGLVRYTLPYPSSGSYMQTFKTNPIDNFGKFVDIKLMANVLPSIAHFILYAPSGSRDLHIVDACDR